MHRGRSVLIAWLAALCWIAGWGLHANMALAQGAASAQICVSGERGAPADPVQGARVPCSACVQALSAAADAPGRGSAEFLSAASDERLAAAQVGHASRTHRIAAHAPRAPPAA